MAQLRILVDIVGFDLTHVYLKLDVLRDRDASEAERAPDRAQRDATLRLTLPECHVFLRALREFHGLIEVTTPILEETKRPKTEFRAGHQGDSAEPAPENSSGGSLDTIIERLNARAAERSHVQTGT